MSISVIQSLLIDAIEHAVDGNAVIFCLFFVFVRKFLLGASIGEEGLVRYDGKI